MKAPHQTTIDPQRTRNPNPNMIHANPDKPNAPTITASHPTYPAGPRLFPIPGATEPSHTANLPSYPHPFSPESKSPLPTGEG